MDKDFASIALFFCTFQWKLLPPKFFQSGATLLTFSLKMSFQEWKREACSLPSHHFSKEQFLEKFFYGPSGYVQNIRPRTFVHIAV